MAQFPSQNSTLIPKSLKDHHNSLASCQLTKRMRMKMAHELQINFVVEVNTCTTRPSFALTKHKSTPSIIKITKQLFHVDKAKHKVCVPSCGNHQPSTTSSEESLEYNNHSKLRAHATISLSEPLVNEFRFQHEL